MQSAYYDTPKGDLQNSKWSLRLRRENDTPIVTLKTLNKTSMAENLFVRNEWQFHSDSVEEAVEPLIELGAPEKLRDYAQAGFTEQFQVNFTRQSAMLYLPGGVRIDMGVDFGEVVAGQKNESLMELELELLFGDESSISDLAAYLETKYGLEKEFISKYERALRLIRRRR
jgi:inorganic triphosphatase YgiF